MRRTRPPLSRTWLYPLALLLLPFGLFGAEAIGRRVFYFHDVQYYFFPYHKLVADIVASGHLPLWNPYAFSGIPLVGDGQTAMFYPPNWLFFFLPAIHAVTLNVLLHFSLAGVGMWAYVRGLRLGTLAALVAALAFMFNGFLVARVVHLSIMAGAALIPLVFWSYDRLLLRRSVGAFGLCAAIVGAQALAGHPQVPIYTALGLGLYGLVVGLRAALRAQRWPALVGPLALLPAIYGAGYALAAVQLAPWIEFASFSPRAAGASYGFVTFQSLRGLDWLLFLFPYGYGGPRTSWMQSAPAWDLPVYLWERLAYMGLVPPALALVGLCDLRRRPRERDADEQHDRLWALLAVLVVMALVAAGSATPFGRLVYLLPAVGKLRAYARAVAVCCFAVAALAAFGVARLQRVGAAAPTAPDRAPLVAAAILAVLVGGALLVANVAGAGIVAGPDYEPMYRVMLGRGLQLTSASAYVPLALAIATVGVLWRVRRGLRGVTSALLLAVLLVDLGGFAATFNPITDPAVFTRVPPSVEFLRRDRSAYRTASFISNDRLPPAEAQAQLAISWAIAYGVEDINGFNSLQPRRYTDFLFGPEVEDVSYGFLHDSALLDPGNHMLSMLDVKYALVQPQSSIWQAGPPPEERVPPDEESPAWRRVYGDATVTIYRNPVRYGRAYFVPEVTPVADPQAILTVVKQPTWDPRSQALVESGIDVERARELSRGGRATVDVTQVAPDELRITTDTDADRFLVLSEMWFPGWWAEIDGVALPIYRTNYLLRGLVVPAGQHTIRMRYRPASLVLGAGITLGMITSLGAVWLVTQSRRGGRIREGTRRKTIRE